MKKAFTLIEVVLSVSLLAIIVLFLYKTLDMTKSTNSFYTERLKQFKNQNGIKILMFEDMINKEQNTTVKLIQDKNENTIFTFKSSNTFHNPFSTQISYFVSKEQNLIRCESKVPFDKNKINSFVEEPLTYIDIVDKNISKFNMEQGKDKESYVVYLEYEDKKDIFFTLKPLQ